MASFLFPTWGPGSPDSTFRLPVHHTSTKESPMITKFFAAFSTRNETNSYAHLPQRIQDEIKSADEATSVYDIR